MKKLMIAAAIVCAAAISQAATYDWAAVSDWITATEDDEVSSFGGNKVYFFDSQTISAANFIAALGTGTTVFEQALGSSAVKTGGLDGSYNFTGSGITGYTPDTDTYVSGYAVLLDAANLADAKYAYVYEYDPIKVTTTVEKSGATFYAEEIYTGAVGGAGWTSIGGGDVPEPTSGLLLLLGMAGLALRRRRA